MSLGGGYVYPLILNEAANIHNSLKNYKLHYEQHCSNQYLEIVLSEFPDLNFFIFHITCRIKENTTHSWNGDVAFLLQIQHREYIWIRGFHSD
jgi:hypothetical protein